jgi:hypothetical protein
MDSGPSTLGVEVRRSDESRRASDDEMGKMRRPCKIPLAHEIQRICSEPFGFITGQGDANKAGLAAEMFVYMSRMMLRC